ncbi:MAG: twin-arginine translocase TatA/TatE family subunit [Rhizobiales bacterium]|jgi:sec-independent protein translocase protein TatA|nr:twin-arginine translocase TatA/TatE family subunit [Rhodobiaceae bacterium]MBL6623505.1 twin-arginine translocase TatA/TatE family subunit [Hyphomicrobiales bacterium]MBL6770190.1 twin-arginine translocase TatA/TatE family subunit [Hyphomicrobiales bacterium]RPF97400.1 MAG: twin-arginine translocase TatA/TatE family subunit [Rhizobiales bacterium TMED227]|tara:strand:- start:268 stop:459 length:192 start_codon:yes stop_codon:yes gene_type:complete
MGISGFWQWVVIGLIVLLLFSRPGKISKMLGDLGVGLRSFRDGVKGEIKETDDDTEDSNKDSK